MSYIPTNVERVDCNEDGSLDDVALSVNGGMFRIEQMSKGNWWIAVHLPDGRSFVVRLYSKRRIHAVHQWESP